MDIEKIQMKKHVILLDLKTTKSIFTHNDVTVLTCGDRVLRNNQLDGTLDVGTAYSNQLQLIDLQNNSIEGFTTRAKGYDKKLM